MNCYTPVASLRRARKVARCRSAPERKRLAHRAMRRWVRQRDLTDELGCPPRTKRCTSWDLI
jgi:hypothetical protein